MFLKCKDKRFYKRAGLIIFLLFGLTVHLLMLNFVPNCNFINCYITYSFISKKNIKSIE